MHSFSLLALGLTLNHVSAARMVDNSNRLQHPREARQAQHNGLLQWFARILPRGGLENKVAARDEICVQDDFFNIASSNYGRKICPMFVDYGTSTVTQDYTPTSTTTDVYTTNVATHTAIVRTTPYTTAVVTVTESNDTSLSTSPTPTLAPRGAIDVPIAEIAQMLRRQKADDTTTYASDDIYTSMSSACECQTGYGSTVTATYTNEPVVETQSAFAREDTTVVIVSTARLNTQTSTTTVRRAVAANPPGTAAPGTAALGTAVASSASTSRSLESSASSTSSSASVSPPTPTSPAFTCPEDNGTVVSQMVGNQRFDYLILCDYDLLDANFYDQGPLLSFSECAAACSVADSQFNSPVCQGLAFYSTASPNSGHNCFLKKSANQTVPVKGVNSALLQRIAVGISDTSPLGTATESEPFSSETPTPNDSQMSSSMSVIMSNSSTNIPIITPGPTAASGLLVNGPYTAYSTYISDGSTFSSGTVFSTYYSSNGSYYYSYYTSYTLAWSSETTVYGAQETGYVAQNSTNSNSHTDQSEGGGYSEISQTNYTTYYPEGYNVTEVTSNVTYGANGTELSSTAVTSYYSYSTGTSGSGNGSGSNGGAGGSGAGNITSTGSISVFSTQTASSGVVETGSPSVWSSAWVSTYGTAYSSGYVVSGVIGEGSGGNGGAGSGAVSTITPSVFSSVVVNTYGTAYSSGYVVSGAIGGGSGGNGGAGSGVIVTGSPSVFSSVVVNSYGTAYSSGYVVSGAIGGGSGGSGTAGSGVITGTGSYTPIYSTANSFGTGGASSTVESGAAPPTGTGLTPISSTLASTGFGSASSTLESSVVPPTGTGLTPISSTVGSTGFGSASSFFTSGAIPSSETTNSSSVSPTPTAATSSTRSRSSSRAPRSGEETTSILPTGSAPGPAPYIPYSPSSSGSAPVPTSTGVLPFPSSYVLPTGSYSGSSRPPFSHTGAPRSGTGESSSLSYTANDTYPAPSGSGTAPSSPETIIPSSGTGPLIPGTTPAYTGTGPIAPANTGTAPAGTSPAPTGSAPSPVGTASSPSGTASSSRPSFSHIWLPPTGGEVSSGVATGTSPASGTAPVSGTAPNSGTAPWPTAPYSCSTGILGTTTIFTTITSYGCYSQCPPSSTWGYGDGPPPFGPPPVSARR